MQPVPKPLHVRLAPHQRNRPVIRIKRLHHIPGLGRRQPAARRNQRELRQTNGDVNAIPRRLNNNVAAAVNVGLLFPFHRFRLILNKSPHDDTPLAEVEPFSSPIPSEILKSQLCQPETFPIHSKAQPPPLIKPRSAPVPGRSNVETSKIPRFANPFTTLIELFPLPVTLRAPKPRAASWTAPVLWRFVSRGRSCAIRSTMNSHAPLSFQKCGESGLLEMFVSGQRRRRFVKRFPRIQQGEEIKRVGKDRGHFFGSPLR